MRMRMCWFQAPAIGRPKPPRGDMLRLGVVPYNLVGPQRRERAYVSGNPCGVPHAGAMSGTKLCLHAPEVTPAVCPYIIIMDVGRLEVMSRLALVHDSVQGADSSRFLCRMQAQCLKWRCACAHRGQLPTARTCITQDVGRFKVILRIRRLHNGAGQADLSCLWYRMQVQCMA